MRTWHHLEGSPSSLTAPLVAGAPGAPERPSRSRLRSRRLGPGPAGATRPSGSSPRPWVAPPTPRPPAVSHRPPVPRTPPGPTRAAGCPGDTDRSGSCGGAGAWCEGNSSRARGPTGPQAGRARSGRNGPGGPSRTARAARHSERGAGGARPRVPAPRSTAQPRPAQHSSPSRRRCPAVLRSRHPSPVPSAPHPEQGPVPPLPAPGHGTSARDRKSVV